jgi:glycosyltransferase involved in cell wall biosynthesis
MARMPAAHVILATYNQERFLPRVLRGYLRQTTTDFHLSVADDGSSDGTAVIVQDLVPAFAARGIGLSHVHHEDRGFRKCRILNEAVRRGPAARLLVFSDGDCIPPAAFVERHRAAHEPRSLHVGGAWRLTQAQCTALDEAGVEAGAYESLRTQRSARDLRKKRRQSIWGTRLGRRHRPKILGLNFALDRALFEALNGFDERFTTWGLGEDTDVRDRAMRLRPKPRVKVLYGSNDVFHLWHPENPSERRHESRAYYERARPIRCERGLRSD